MYKGSGSVRFSELFKDNMVTHGWGFCFELYCLKGKMPRWEFDTWYMGYLIEMHGE